MTGFSLGLAGVTYTLEGVGEAKTLLEGLDDKVLHAGLYEAVTKAAADVVRGHLKARDHTHANKMGGKRSHFYWNAANTVREEANAEGGTITINYTGLRQRWLGGDIYPVNAKLLAIPARSESYGIPPKEFGDLKFIQFKSGAKALVKDDQTHTVDWDSGGYRNLSTEAGERKSRKKGIGLVEYWLVDHVYQKPDPSVMPAPEAVLDGVVAAASEYLQTR